MDKAAIGNTSLGLVHAVYELYGPDKAGLLLSALGRMLTYYLQVFIHVLGYQSVFNLLSYRMLVIHAVLKT